MHDATPSPRCPSRPSATRWPRWATDAGTGWPCSAGSASTTSPSAWSTSPSTTGADEPRAVGATCGGVRVWSVYVPNGREPDHDHYRYKLDWFAALRATVAGRAGRRTRAGRSPSSATSTSPRPTPTSGTSRSSRAAPTSPRRARGPRRPARRRAAGRHAPRAQGRAVHVLGLPPGGVRPRLGHAHRPRVRQRGLRRPGRRHVRRPRGAQGQGRLRPRSRRGRPRRRGPPHDPRASARSPPTQHAEWIAARAVRVVPAAARVGAGEVGLAQRVPRLVRRLAARRRRAGPVPAGAHACRSASSPTSPRAPTSTGCARSIPGIWPSTPGSPRCSRTAGPRAPSRSRWARRWPCAAGRPTRSRPRWRAATTARGRLSEVLADWHSGPGARAVERLQGQRLDAAAVVAAPASATCSRATSSRCRSPIAPSTTSSPASTSCGGATSARPRRPASSSADGTRDDLADFHRVYVETAHRDHFTPRGLAYFERMWDALNAQVAGPPAPVPRPSRRPPRRRHAHGRRRARTPGTPTAPRPRPTATCGRPTPCSGA